MKDRLDIIPLTEWGYFKLPPRPCVIAGPCSAESEEQVMLTASQLRAFGINMYRAGIWKPRTHPGCFEGAGVEGLKWLSKAKQTYGVAICTEVASQKHVFECIKYGVDMVWLGARTTANPFLVEEIAEALEGTDIPVLVKNPVNPDLDLWIGALERLNRHGIKKLGVIHRGFTSFDKIRYRNAPDWEIAIELRSLYPELAFFCDPSHMAGSREYIREISQRAMDLGLDGLMIESHCNPDVALSDARQQLTPAQLEDLLWHQLIVRDATTDGSDFKEKLAEQRTRIDVLDESIIDLLARRMDASREIGRLKRDNNVAIIQASRWEDVLYNAMRKGEEKGLDPEYIKAVFNHIHDASVAEQNKILEKS